jgi:hypothetical protein
MSSHQEECTRRLLPASFALFVASMFFEGEPGAIA